QTRCGYRIRCSSSSDWAHARLHNSGIRAGHRHSRKLRSRPETMESAYAWRRPVRSFAQIRAVVFDMDGVLINSHPTHLAAWKAFLACVGKQVPEHELNYILEGRTRNEILCHFLGELPPQELQQYGKQKDEIFRGMEHQIEPVAGAVEFLRTLSQTGISTAI